MQPLPKTLFAFIWYFLKKHWVSFLIVQLCYFAWTIDSTLWPYVIMVLIDTITQYSGDRSEAWAVLTTPIIMGISLWIVVEILYRGSGFLSAIIMPKLEGSIRLSMFDYVQRHSHTYFSNNFTGSIANKISDMPQSVNRILELIMRLFIPVFAAIIFSSALFTYINPYFGMILLGWIFVHMGICIICAKKCDRYSHIHAESRSALSGKIVDSLTNHMNVKLFSRFAYENRYLTKFQNDEVKKHTKLLFYMERMKIYLSIASFCGAFLALNWFMLHQWVQGKLSTGEVVFIFNTAWNITMMAWLAGLEIPSLFLEMGICQQALTIIQDTHDIVDKPNALPLAVKKGEITFDKVSFQYSPNNYLFKNKNLVIKAGENIGLVGFSGSGKTTFVNLILRYFDIEKGRILIDGHNIADVSQESLREQIAMIPQDTSLFHRTLIENIRYGRLEATDEEVFEAARRSHCHEFIVRLPQGYETLVGERGIKLSGGQRQRIAIARALLKNAPILILDEATSALDSVTEQYIREGLSHLMDGRTTIVIAHRLSTLLGMDRILVFSDGKIIEEGSHHKLLNKKGHYAKLWEMQAGGFLPPDEDEDS